MSHDDIDSLAKSSFLGKSVGYVTNYSPDLLFPIARQNKRDELGINDNQLPFKGCDVWNGYELSWLNLKGKPIAAIIEFIIPCESPNIIESKSVKLYLNSFNQTQFENKLAVIKAIKRDFSHACGMDVEVKVWELEEYPVIEVKNINSLCIDHLDIACNVYLTEPAFLKADEAVTVEEKLHSNLLRSNCLVTKQPDWGSVEISYKGPKINHEGLLKYIVSFRHHIEFHEQCVERIFMDILACCKPEKLTVEARYTRRGGLDINPFRTTETDVFPLNMRLNRQ